MAGRLKAAGIAWGARFGLARRLRRARVHPRTRGLRPTGLHSLARRVARARVASHTGGVWLARCLGTSGRLDARGVRRAGGPLARGANDARVVWGARGFAGRLPACVANAGRAIAGRVVRRLFAEPSGPIAGGGKTGVLCPARLVRRACGLHAGRAHACWPRAVSSPDE